MELSNNIINPQILVLILLLNFLIYVGIVWVKFGVQKSISDSYYSWKNPWGLLFVLFTWVLAFSLILLGLSFTEPIKLLAFASGGGFGFVGAASMIHMEETRKVHMKAAYIGIGSALLMIGFGFGGWYWLAIGISLVISALLFLMKVKDKIWWAELVMFGVIMGSLLFRYF